MTDAPLFAPAPASVSPRTLAGLRPRWYQAESFDQIRAWYEAARKARAPFARGLISWATGGGKGWGALEVVNAFPELVAHGYLFLVEYDSIVWQQAREFREAFPHLSVQVEKANYRADFSTADIVVASVQTLGKADPTHPKGFNKRLLRIPPVGVVVYDEAHRLVHGGMGDRVLSHLGMSEGKYGPMVPARRPGPETPGLFLAMTATPNRKDGQGLYYWTGANYTVNPYADPDAVSDTFDLRCMIEEGFLVEPRGYHVYTESDLSDVSVRRGQMDSEELKEVIVTEARNLQIIKAYLDYQPPVGGHAIVFTKWVDHAYALADLFRQAGVSAEAGDGEMKRDEKRAVEARFKSGETSVLVNCNLWSVGYNAPICNMILHAEPTFSQPLYSQRGGRATRAVCDLRGLEAREDRAERLARIAASSKPYWVNIDFVDSSKRAGYKRHPLVTAVNLFGLPSGIDPEGGRLIRDIVEPVEKAQREHPTKKILDGAKSLADIQVNAERVNVWDVLETAPEILEASDNRWLQLREGVIELAVPESKSFAQGRDYRARAVQEVSGAWRVDRVYPSRWDGAARRQQPERIAKGKHHYDSKEAAMGAVDYHLKTDRAEIQRLVSRQADATWKATAKQINYMRKLGASAAGVLFTEAGNPIHLATGKTMTGAQVSETIDALKAMKGL